MLCTVGKRGLDNIHSNLSGLEELGRMSGGDFRNRLRRMEHHCCLLVGWLSPSGERTIHSGSGGDSLGCESKFRVVKMSDLFSHRILSSCQILEPCQSRLLSMMTSRGGHIGLGVQECLFRLQSGLEMDRALVWLKKGTIPNDVLECLSCACLNI